MTGDSEELLMHAHKPKPVHNWRELGTEIAVIVIGVLIALFLEQMVENWREHRQYREARQAMLDELAGNLANARQRQRYVGCTLQRMKEVDAILDRAEAGQPITPPSWIGPVTSFRMRFVAESEAAKSTLFSSAEQRDFGSPYSYFHSIEAEQDRERLAWGHLQMLENRSRLSPEMIQSLRNALADARYENYRLVYLTQWAQAWGRQLSLKDLSRAPSYADSFFVKSHPHCLPLDMPTDQAERESGLRANLQTWIQNAREYSESGQ